MRKSAHESGSADPQPVHTPDAGAVWAAEPCPVCDGIEYSGPVLVRDNRTGVFVEPIAVRSCRGCGTWGLRPLPAPETLDAAYVAGYGPYVAEARIRSLSSLQTTARRWWHVVDGQASIDRLQLQSPVLDVGAGQGRNVAYLLARGVDVTGIEPNPMAVDVCQRQGLPVHQGDLTSVELRRGSWGTILLDQVIEHVPNPAETVRLAYELLAAGGRIALMTPNAGGLQHQLFGREWAHWHVPYHIYLYGPQQLRALLRRAGFHEVRVRTVSPAFWTTMSLASWRHHSQSTGWVLPPDNDQPHLAARLALAPLLRLVDLLRFGDCLVAEAVKP